MSERVSRWWTRWGAWILFLLFVAVFFALLVRKHDSFHTRALDLAKFDQAIWNTLHGRFLFSTLESQSILGNHFSPFMALLAPLFWIWDDVRVLFLVQTLGLALAGLVLHKIVQGKHPKLAPWFLLAYYLNPALHEVALVEFRRVTLAVPFLALALYGLYIRKRRWLIVGLAFALLCKEDIGLIVFMMGVYLILFERDWKWGVPLAAVGITWVAAVTLWVIPTIVDLTGGTDELYPQINYLCLEGDSYGDILLNLLREPQVLFQRMFDREALLALLRIFFPLGLILPFLAPDWLMLVVPSLAYMLFSCNAGMHRLQSWYMASVLPGLFAAVAVALTRLSEQKARWATVSLLAATLISYPLLSYAPLGAKFDPTTYRVTDHHRLAAKVVNAIPDDARVAAQDPYVPHLAHREYIYLFPWVRRESKVDYTLLDRQAHSYPLDQDELNDMIDGMLANSSIVIEMEGDGIYLFWQRGDQHPAFPVGAVAGETMLLGRAEVALLGEDGFFHTEAYQEPIELRPGQQVRISLYWKALDAVGAERKVSVRVVDATGVLAGQSDGIPGRGKQPTGSWHKGLEIRDVHYLTISPQAQLGPGSLDVVVYDSLSTEVVPFDSGAETLRLRNVVLIP
jgi:uncharacterized membrane protein